jgi:hypothetical protein
VTWAALKGCVSQEMQQIRVVPWNAISLSPLHKQDFCVGWMAFLFALLGWKSVDPLEE